MKYLLAIAVLALAVVSPAAAQAPKGTPPIFKIVAGTEPAKGLILFNEILLKTEIREEKRKVLKNGIEVEETVKVQVMVPVLVSSAMDVNRSRIITPDGKQLPIDEVWKRVKASTVIVVSGDNNVPDPAFLRALNADTVIIVSLPPKGRPK
jgi:hypothetical protein